MSIPAVAHLLLVKNAQQEVSEAQGNGDYLST